jgi:hypothetical protein
LGFVDAYPKYDLGIPGIGTDKSLGEDIAHSIDAIVHLIFPILRSQALVLAR